jgi:hypothetical protein
MSTYSAKFDHLIRNHPGAAAPLGRLRSYLEQDEVHDSTYRELTIGTLVDAVSPVNATTLKKLLDLLVSEGLFERIVRVESSSNGGIADFHSILEVPDQILDWRIDQHVKVTPDMLRVIYRKQ